jgi:hypothetical protein
MARPFEVVSIPLPPPDPQILTFSGIPGHETKPLLTVPVIKEPESKTPFTAAIPDKYGDREPFILPLIPEMPEPGYLTIAHIAREAGREERFALAGIREPETAAGQETPAAPPERVERRGGKAAKLLLPDRAVTSGGPYRGLFADDLVMELGEGEYRTLDEVREEDLGFYKAMEETGLVGLIMHYSGGSGEIPDNMFQLIKEHSPREPRRKRPAAPVREKPPEPEIKPKLEFHARPRDDFGNMICRVMSMPVPPSDDDQVYGEMIENRVLKSPGSDSIKGILAYLRDAYDDRIWGMMEGKIAYFFNLPCLAMLQGNEEREDMVTVARDKLRYQIQTVGLVDKFARESGIKNDGTAEDVMRKCLSYAFGKGLSFYGKKSGEIGKMMEKYRM